jgi:hypothetical protein
MEEENIFACDKKFAVQIKPQLRLSPNCDELNRNLKDWNENKRTTKHMENTKFQKLKKFQKLILF